MEDVQQQLNLNVQERLRALEAQQQVNLVLLMALISTHPNRKDAERIFVEGTERIVSRWLSSQLQEDWIDAGVQYRALLLQVFEQPISPSA